MTFKQQSELYMDQLAVRKRNPVKKATLHAYRSYLSNWILPELGKLPLQKVENGVMKALVGQMVTAGRSASTIAGVTNCVKEIVASSTDTNGNQLHPRTWNTDFIDAPVITSQKAPIMAQITLQEALGRTQTGSSQFGTLVRLLAATGLRVSESLALKTYPNPDCSYWDRERSILVIKTQLYKGVMQSPKTVAGVREIDLDPRLNEYLKNYATGDTLFTISIHAAYRMAKKFQIPGFHSLRRFRATHLENQNVPRGIFKFWLGHAGEDISDRYVKVGAEIQARKEWAQKAGLGFELPQ